MQVETLKMDFPFSPAIDRTPGLHVSEIISDMMIDLNRFKDKKLDEKARMNMEKGFLWERMLELAWKDMLGVRIGEVEKDGILMSPDGQSIVGAHPWLEEYKATVKSSNKPITANLHWMMQIKAYMYTLGLNECRLHVWYIAGDYRPPLPDYKVYRLIPESDTALRENWDNILNHARFKGML